jgi:hypothetical protein
MWLACSEGGGVIILRTELVETKKRLAVAEAVINKVVEINIHRDDEGGFFCHECKSWNHSANESNTCTTAMLQDFLSTPTSPDHVLVD